MNKIKLIEAIIGMNENCAPQSIEAEESFF